MTCDSCGDPLPPEWPSSVCWACQDEWQAIRKSNNGEPCAALVGLALTGLASGVLVAWMLWR